MLLRCFLNVRALRYNIRDSDILANEHQPIVICLQETKLVHSPPLSHWCSNYDCFHKLLRNPDHVEESQSTSRKDCTTSWFRLTLTFKRPQSMSHLVVLLSLPFLSTSQATTTSPPEICHIWSETLEAKYLSWLTSMGTTLYGKVMILTSRVKSLRDSLINTIRVFSMMESTPIWNLKPSMRTNHCQWQTSQTSHQDLLWEVRGKSCLIPMVVNIIPYWLRFYHQWQRHNQAVGFGLDLFNDDTRPSGHISRPTQVNVSQSCFHSLDNYSSLIILYTSRG